MKKLIIFTLILFLVSLAKAISVQNGATDVTTYFVMRDQTAGTVDDGVVLANIDLYYMKDGAAMSAKRDANDLGSAAAAHDDWEVYDCNLGLYRADWPDAAFDGGVNKRVQLIVVDGDGGAFTEIMEIELSPPGDVTEVAGTAAAATNMLIVFSTDFATGYDTTADMWNVDLTLIEGVDATDTMLTESAIAGQVVTEMDANSTVVTDGLAAINLDHLMYNVISNTATIPEVNDASLFSLLMTKTDGDVSDFDFTTDSLEAVADTIGVAGAGLSDLGGMSTTMKAQVEGEVDDSVDANMAVVIADTSELQTDWADGGRLDLILDTAATAGTDANELRQEWNDGGRLDLILDAILVDTSSTLDDLVDELESLLKDSTYGLSALETLIDALDATTAEEIWQYDISTEDTANSAAEYLKKAGHL